MSKHNVRYLDDVNRISLPRYIREDHDIKPKQAIEFYVDGDTVVLKKYNHLATREEYHDVRKNKWE